jgi:hypothetical protein
MSIKLIEVINNSPDFTVYIMPLAQFAPRVYYLPARGIA